MGFINSKLLTISILIVSGILLAKHVCITLQYSLLALSLSILFFLFAWLHSKNKLYPSYLFGCATYFLFIVFGVFLLSIHNPKNKPYYYGNNKNDAKLIKIVLQEKLKNTTYQQRFIAQVKETVNKNNQLPKYIFSAGKLLVYMPLDGIFEVGNQYYIPAKYQSISAPKNHMNSIIEII